MELIGFLLKIIIPVLLILYLAKTYKDQIRLPADETGETGEHATPPPPRKSILKTISSIRLKLFGSGINISKAASFLKWTISAICYSFRRLFFRGILIALFSVVIFSIGENLIIPAITRHSDYTICPVDKKTSSFSRDTSYNQLDANSVKVISIDSAFSVDIFKRSHILLNIFLVIASIIALIRSSSGELKKTPARLGAAYCTSVSVLYSIYLVWHSVTIGNNLMYYNVAYSLNIFSVFLRFLAVPITLSITLYAAKYIYDKGSQLRLDDIFSGMTKMLWALLFLTAIKYLLSELSLLSFRSGELFHNNSMAISYVLIIMLTIYEMGMLLVAFLMYFDNMGFKSACKVFGGFVMRKKFEFIALLLVCAAIEKAMTVPAVLYSKSDYVYRYIFSESNHIIQFSINSLMNFISILCHIFILLIIYKFFLDFVSAKAERAEFPL